jgi:hydroxyacylglutathione hydrolase
MFALTPGKAIAIADGVWRVLALNPGMMSGPGTNSYLLEDENGLLVVDPGPDDERHLNNLIEAAKEIGLPISAVLCTHTHRDHSPLAARISAQLSVPMIGPAVISDNLQDESWHPARQLSDGECLPLANGQQLKAISTPGHVSNHLCYLIEPLGLLLSGDHLINGSTVVIAPPSGSMSAYLSSLQKLNDYAINVIAPGHGELIEDPQKVVTSTIEHRLKREQKVLEALEKHAGEPCTAAKLVPAVYSDVPVFLHPIAEFSLLAHLIKLAEDEKVEQLDAQTFQLSAA